jgi:hypothetical protein
LKVHNVDYDVGKTFVFGKFIFVQKTAPEKYHTNPRHTFVTNINAKTVLFVPQK